MKIELTGTGTSQGIPVIGCQCEVCQSTDPRDRRLRTSAIFKIHGQHIGIDCGPDFRQQMLRAGIKKLRSILITHTHNDHIAGLDDIRPYNFSMQRPMPIYGMNIHLKEIKERFAYIFSDKPYPGSPSIEPIDIEPFTYFEVNNIQILPIILYHGKIEVLGFRIGNYAYLTDTNDIPKKSIRNLKNLDVLILDSLHHREHHAHFNFEQSIEMAQHIGAKTTYFTHISHQMGLHNNVNKDCPSGIQLGYDGLVI